MQLRISSKGDKKRALELLDLASAEIPVAKYNDPRSLAEIVYGYIVAGQEQKGLKLAEELKRIFLMNTIISVTWIRHSRSL